MISEEDLDFPNNIYCVLGDGDMPHRMVFNISDAFKSNYQYIDCFDHKGNLLNIFGRRLDEEGNPIRDIDEEVQCISAIRTCFVNPDPLDKSIPVLL